MKTAFKCLLILGLVLGLLGLLASGLVWQGIAAQPNLHITINGEALDLQDFAGMPWAGPLFTLLTGAVIVCLVVPMILLFGLGLPLLLLGLVLAFVLLGVFGLGTMLFSPFLVLGLLLWLLLRNKQPKRLRTDSDPGAR